METRKAIVLSAFAMRAATGFDNVQMTPGPDPVDIPADLFEDLVKAGHIREATDFDRKAAIEGAPENKGAGEQVTEPPAGGEEDQTAAAADQTAPASDQSTQDADQGTQDADQTDRAADNAAGNEQPADEASAGTGEASPDARAAAAQLLQTAGALNDDELRKSAEAIAGGPIEGDRAAIETKLRELAQPA